MWCVQFGTWLKLGSRSKYTIQCCTLVHVGSLVSCIGKVKVQLSKFMFVICSDLGVMPTKFYHLKILIIDFIVNWFKFLISTSKCSYSLSPAQTLIQAYYQRNRLFNNVQMGYVTLTRNGKNLFGVFCFLKNGDNRDDSDTETQIWSRTVKPFHRRHDKHSKVI